MRGQVARLLPCFPSSSSASDAPLLLLGFLLFSSPSSQDSALFGGAAGLFLDEETYLIRNVDFVVAGGTGQVARRGREPRAADRESILARCGCSARICSRSASTERPGKELFDRGLGRAEAAAVPREARGAQVVEVAAARKKAGGRRRKAAAAAEREEEKKWAVLVVSNYGHGGSGFTLHQGCAGDAAALVPEGLKGKGGGDG